MLQVPKVLTVTAFEEDEEGETGVIVGEYQRAHPMTDASISPKMPLASGRRGSFAFWDNTTGSGKADDLEYQ